MSNGVCLRRDFRSAYNRNWLTRLKEQMSHSDAIKRPDWSNAILRQYSDSCGRESTGCLRRAPRGQRCIVGPELGYRTGERPPSAGCDWFDCKRGRPETTRMSWSWVRCIPNGGSREQAGVVVEWLGHFALPSQIRACGFPHPVLPESNPRHMRACMCE
jgi:hypothetical protein